jgi:hypothetical protein
MDRSYRVKEGLAAEKGDGEGKVFHRGAGLTFEKVLPRRHRRGREPIGGAVGIPPCCGREAAVLKGGAPKLISTHGGRRPRPSI